MRLHRRLVTQQSTVMELAASCMGDDLLISSTHVRQQPEQAAPDDDIRLTAMPSAATESVSFREHFQCLIGQSLDLKTQVMESDCHVAVLSSSQTEASLSDADEESLTSQLLAVVREELTYARQVFPRSFFLTPAAQEMVCSQTIWPQVESLQKCVMPVHGVHVLAGPSGAGKSTLAARLAQWSAQEFGPEQVALISYHDLRAGAWNQAQSLGARVGVQVFRALDAGTLGLLLEEVGRRALVVIDTPSAQMAEHVQQIVAVSPQAQVHAVMQADASLASCRRVLQGSGIAFAGLMLTKCDEVETPWASIKTLCQCAAPLHVSLVDQTQGLLQCVC